MAQGTNGALLALGVVGAVAAAGAVMGGRGSKNPGRFSKMPKSAPLGWLEDLRELPEASRTIMKPGLGAFSEERLRTFASRDAMKAFLRNMKGEHGWRAMIMDEVEPNMVIYRSFQRGVR
jgi:hypothetical protein